MLANELRKGTRVVLRNGWHATMADNARGNIRMATVEGVYTETGSVYAHDIACVEATGEPVTLSPAQSKAAARIKAAGF